MVTFVWFSGPFLENHNVPRMRTSHSYSLYLYLCLFLCVSVSVCVFFFFLFFICVCFFYFLFPFLFVLKAKLWMRRLALSSLIDGIHLPLGQRYININSGRVLPTHLPPPLGGLPSAPPWSPAPPPARHHQRHHRPFPLPQIFGALQLQLHRLEGCAGAGGRPGISRPFQAHVSLFAGQDVCIAIHHPNTRLKSNRHSSTNWRPNRSGSLPIYWLFAWQSVLMDIILLLRNF